MFLSLRVRGSRPIATHKTVRSTPMSRLCFHPQVESLEGRLAPATLTGTSDGAAALPAYDLLGPTIVFVTPNFVNEAYRHLLGRAPQEPEVAYWSNRLESGSSREQVALEIQNSFEGRTHVVDSLFRLYLNRPVDARGLKTFVPELLGGATIGQVRAEVLGSDEYYQEQSKGTDAGFLTELLEDVLGRTFRPGDLAFSLALFRRVSRSVVATQVLSSTEAKQHLVRHLYELHFGRPADSQGLPFFTSILQGGGRQEHVVAKLLASAEFTAPFTRLGGPLRDPNGVFVMAVYEDLLSRPADQNGLTFWTSQLDQFLLTRSQVTLAIEETNEYLTDVVENIYQTLLKRDADSQGLNTYVPFLASFGTIEQVQAVIAGSTEYFQNRGAGTINGFLTNLYLDLLDRQVDQTGLQNFGTALANGTATTTSVAGAILTSQEYRTDLVQGYYVQFLNRAADPVGLAQFVTALLAGATDQDVIATIVGSQEYFINATGG